MFPGRFLYLTYYVLETKESHQLLIGNPKNYNAYYLSNISFLTVACSCLRVASFSRRAYISICLTAYENLECWCMHRSSKVDVQCSFAITLSATACHATFIQRNEVTVRSISASSNSFSSFARLRAALSRKYLTRSTIEDQFHQQINSIVLLSISKLTFDIPFRAFCLRKSTRYSY